MLFLYYAYIVNILGVCRFCSNCNTRIELMCTFEDQFKNIYTSRCGPDHKLKNMLLVGLNKTHLWKTLKYHWLVVTQRLVLITKNSYCLSSVSRRQGWYSAAHESIMKWMKIHSIERWAAIFTDLSENGFLSFSGLTTPNIGRTYRSVSQTKLVMHWKAADGRRKFATVRWCQMEI